VAKARVKKVTGVAAILAESATPDTYRRNPFRVLELAADCGELQISKRLKLIEIAVKTGQPVPAGEGRALPIQGSRDGVSPEEAARRLRNPEERLAAEFFWFWPHRLGESDEDDALAALREDDLEKAVDLWVDQANARSEDNASLHNLAVLSHALALDVELKARERRLSPAEISEAAIYWRQTYSRWNRLLSEACFWERLKRRVHDLGDPRITDATVDEIRSSLPRTVLLINAKLALEAAERGNLEATTRHLALMDGSGFLAVYKEEALVTSVQPIRQQITALCNAAKLSAENDPVHADRTTREMLGQCSPLLNAVDLLVGPGNPANVSAHDEVAAQGLANVQAYAGKTQGWNQAAVLAGELLKIAASPSIKDHLSQEARQLRENAGSGNDWCGEGYFDSPPVFLAGLERAREMLGVGDTDGAISILEELYATSPELGPREEGLVRRPLATCLNLRSVRRFQAASEVKDSPPTLVTNIRSQTANNSRALQYTRHIVSIPGALSWPQTDWRMLVCMACGASWSGGNGDWGVWTHGEEKSLVCPACRRRDDNERRERETQFTAAVCASGKDLLRAERLDSTNPAIGRNMTALRGIARSHGITFPNAPNEPILPRRRQRPQAAGDEAGAGGARPRRRQATPLTFDQVKERWPEVLEAVLRRSPATHALISQGRPVGMEGRILTVQFTSDALRTRMDHESNLALLLECLEGVFGPPLAVRCVLREAREAAAGAAPPRAATGYREGVAAGEGSRAARARRTAPRRAEAQDRNHTKGMGHFTAWAVDGMLLVLLFLPFSRSSFNNPWTVFLVPAVYFGLLHLIFKRTPGEAVARARVANLDGSARTPMQRLWRSVLLAALFLATAYTPLALALLLSPLLNKERRGIHDYLAGSLLVGA